MKPISMNKSSRRSNNQRGTWDRVCSAAWIKFWWLIDR